MELLEWWNLIFLLPASAAVLYVLLLAVGALPFDDLGLHLDAGTGHFDHDGPGDHDLLGILGIGRVPISIVLISFSLLWGVIGWFATRAFQSVWPAPGVFIWPSLLVALVGAAGLTRGMANLLGRVMPGTETYGVGARELIGRMAETRYPISASAGSVQVYDQHGALHEVPARVLTGEAVIPAGARVVLWRFDDATGSYLVTQDDALNGLGNGLPAA
ncbi:MAG: DUF1449 family protein [Thermomicrobiales bacterium]|nr:DUF1449 family protein [Thermomicrobiales bacterium]